MSLYGDYIKERENKDIIESDKGFATYTIYPNGECYLQDLYVVPAYRQTGLASNMADKIVEIAREANCNTLIGSVCVDANGATQNLKVFLNYGMQVNKIIGNMIFLKKNITGVKNG